MMQSSWGSYARESPIISNALFGLEAETTPENLGRLWVRKSRRPHFLLFGCFCPTLMGSGLTRFVGLGGLEL